MNKAILAGAALAIAGMMTAGAANAADMPLKAPVYAPAFTWTGLYLGVNAGYGWEDTTGDRYCTNFFGTVGGFPCSAGSPGATKPQGGFVGGQVGYNYQTGMFVWGVETDIQVTNMQNSTGAVPLALPFPINFILPGASATRSESLDWFGTTRGRLGIAFWDRALIYGTGGVMYGEQVSSLNVVFPTAGFLNMNPQSSSVHTGWVAGAGLEYAFTNNFSAKVEGLFYDLGSETISMRAVNGITETANFKYTGSLVRIGANVKFGP